MNYIVVYIKQNILFFNLVCVTFHILLSRSASSSYHNTDSLIVSTLDHEELSSSNHLVKNHLFHIPTWESLFVSHSASTPLT